MLSYISHSLLRLNARVHCIECLQSGICYDRNLACDGSRVNSQYEGGHCYLLLNGLSYYSGGCVLLSEVESRCDDCQDDDGDEEQSTESQRPPEPILRRLHHGAHVIHQSYYVTSHYSCLFKLMSTHQTIHHIIAH